MPVLSVPSLSASQSTVLSVPSSSVVSSVSAAASEGTMSIMGRPVELPAGAVVMKSKRDADNYIGTCMRKDDSNKPNSIVRAGKDCVEAVVGRMDGYSKGVDAGSLSLGRAVENGDGSAGSSTSERVVEMDGNMNTVRDSRLSQSYSRNGSEGRSAVGNGNCGLSNDDIAWMQSGTRGNDRKSKAVKSETEVGTSSSNCNGTTTTKPISNAIGECLFRCCRQPFDL